MTRPTFGARPQPSEPPVPTPPTEVYSVPVHGTVRVPAIPQGTALGSGYSIVLGRVVSWDALWPAVTPTEPRVEGVR